MAEEIEIKVKSDIEETTKETTKLVDKIGILGVTVKDVKNQFKILSKIMSNGLDKIWGQTKLVGLGFKQMFSGKIIQGAKTFWAVIKSGIAATGIGLFVVALGSLAAYFKSTKLGAEKLEKGLKAIGATIGVITQRLAGFGKIITNVFKKPLRETLKDVKENFKGVTTEIKEAVSATLELVTASQKLKDTQRALSVETAKSVEGIEKLKLIAGDITKTYKEREAAAVAAFAKEKELEDKKITLVEEELRLEKERHRIMGENGVMAKDLDALAALEINLANIRQSAIRRQISLQQVLMGLRKDEQERLGELTKMQTLFDRQLEKSQKKELKLAVASDIALENYLNSNKKRKESDQDLADFKDSLRDKSLAALGANLDASMAQMESNYKKEIELAEAQGRDTEGIDKKYEGKRKSLAATQKKFKVAEALITTYQNANLAYQQGLGLPPPAGIAAAPIAAGVAVLAGLANIRQILAQDVGDGGGGSVPAASAETPAPAMVGGSFELGGGITPEPARAYVVSDDITNNQNKLAIIRRRATI